LETRVGASLYELSAVPAPKCADGGGQPPPGTTLTASVETVDNDRAGMMLSLGVVR
jgi:hypothetical protein